MSSIYSLDSNKNLMLYSSGSSVCLRTSTGEALTKPVTLCSDYVSGLSDTLYRNTIYYAYQNTSGDILIRSITDTDPLFMLSSHDTPDCLSPHIIVFCEELLLLYLVRNPVDDTFCPKCLFPFSARKSLSFDLSYSKAPILRLLPLTDILLLAFYDAQDGDTDDIYVVCKDYSYHRLHTPDDLLRRMQSVTEEYEQKWQALVQESEAKLTEQQSKIVSLEQELSKHNAILDSVKLQYDDLMHTALQYRDEALKWRSKFYGG